MAWQSVWEARERARKQVRLIIRSTEALGEAIQKIGASVYEQNPPTGAGPTAGGGTEPGSSSKDDGPEVVDGEVHE